MIKPPPIARFLSLSAPTAVCALLLLIAQPAWSHFIIAPYLQVGDRFSADQHLSLMVRFAIAADEHAAYTVELQRAGNWEQLPPPSSVDINVPGCPAMKIYSEQLTDLPAATDAAYRVLADGKPVFSAQARTPKAKGQPCKIIVVGDCADGSAAQKRLAARMASRSADLSVIAGDIVYSNGRLSEYLNKFFPVYNADKATPAVGAPMLRSMPFIACPGNHDTCVEGALDGSDLSACPDGLSYFYLWRQPLNGPQLPPNLAPRLRGPQESLAAFGKSCNSAFPAMCNFSLDYGSAHILCLDANNYVDWTNADLQQWVDSDLSAASNMPWRLVVFHQACFSSDTNHFEDQQMRLLAPIFEKRNVQVVFSGHSHSYQRSLPLKFAPSLPAKRTAEGFVYGRLQLDRTFDTAPGKKPDGVIYVVTGGGGAPLSIDPRAATADAWQPFTKLYRNDIHCFSECQISDSSFIFRQVADNGKLIDSFELHK